MKTGCNFSTLPSLQPRLHRIRVNKRRFTPFSGPAQVTTERPQSRSAGTQVLNPAESVHASRLNNLYNTAQAVELKETQEQVDNTDKLGQLPSSSSPQSERSEKRPPTSARRKRRYAQRSQPLPDKVTDAQHSRNKATRKASTASSQQLASNEATTPSRQGQRTLSKKEEKALCLAIQVCDVPLSTTFNLHASVAWAVHHFMAYKKRLEAHSIQLLAPESQPLKAASDSHRLSNSLTIMQLKCFDCTAQDSEFIEQQRQLVFEARPAGKDELHTRSSLGDVQAPISGQDYKKLRQWKDAVGANTFAELQARRDRYIVVIHSYTLLHYNSALQ